MREPAWFRWSRVVVLTVLGLFALLPVYVMLTSALNSSPSRGRVPLVPQPPHRVALRRHVVDDPARAIPREQRHRVDDGLRRLGRGRPAGRVRGQPLPVPGRQAFSIVVLSTQMFPGILFLLPLFVIFVNLGQVTGINLYGSRTGLIITYMTFTLPFAIWMLAAYLDTIPRDLDNAAKVDGSSPMGAFIRVVIPAAVPGIVAVLIYAFMTSWSEMLFASVLTNDSTRTLAVGLQGYATQNQVYWNQVMAASLTTSVPIVVGFLLLQRFLVAGMTASVK